MEIFSTSILATVAFQFVRILLQLLSWALIIHVLMSWFATGRSQLGMLVESVVRPLLRPFRWARIGMLDLSVIIVFILLQYGGQVVLRALSQFIG